ncbi:MAG: hypothetical protein P4L86_21720, partial [Mycobacterium sp.]|nr:hypothetical protein [Mycobacterium sp.]
TSGTSELTRSDVLTACCFSFSGRTVMDTQIETSTDRDEDRFVYTVAEAGALLGISRAFS